MRLDPYLSSLSRTFRPTQAIVQTPYLSSLQPPSSSSSSWKRSRRQVTSATVTNRYQTCSPPESFLKQKLASLRAEADVAVSRAEAAELKVKQLEQAVLEKDQEIKSKDHRLDVLEGNYEEASKNLKEAQERYALATQPKTFAHRSTHNAWSITQITESRRRH